jgi:hypothetical protein
MSNERERAAASAMDLMLAVPRAKAARRPTEAPCDMSALRLVLLRHEAAANHTLACAAAEAYAMFVDARLQLALLDFVAERKQKRE